MTHTLTISTSSRSSTAGAATFVLRATIRVFGERPDLSVNVPFILRARDAVQTPFGKLS